MDFLAGFLFGFAAAAFSGAGWCYAERKCIMDWLTTPSDEVSVHTDHDGCLISVVKFSP